METKTIVKTSILVTVMFVAGLLSGYYLAPLMNPQGKYRLNLFLSYELAGGRAEFATHNVITDIGEHEIRNRTSINGTYVFFGYISIGNSTAVQTETQLDSQYSRQLATVANWVNSNDYAFNVTYKWTFTETVNLNASGCHWASTGDNNMGAVASFPNGAQTFDADENLTVRWVWTVDAN